MTSTNSFMTSARALGHYIEQPGLLFKVEKWAYGLGAAGLAGIGISDVYKAKPEEKRKIALRDGLVLSATAAMTLLGAIGFKWMRPVDMKTFAEDVLKPFSEHLPELKKKYPDAAHLLDKLNNIALKTEAEKTKLGGSKVREKLSVAEFKELVSIFKAKNTPTEKIGTKDLEKILPTDNPGTGKFLPDWWDDIKKANAFFGTGLLACLGGLGGGLLANKVNKEATPEKTANMIKEGIFQFIANIALCAVGAGTAMTALNVTPVRNALLRMSGFGKAIRILGISAGLSVGIFGGGVAANKISSKYVNPMLDKMQGKTPQAVKPGEGKRKIEFWDAILHLDDLPTALALAGVAIVEPFIPLFFAFSGYRTGIGYRNDNHSHGHGHHHHGYQENKASVAHANGQHPYETINASNVFQLPVQKKNPNLPTFPMTDSSNAFELPTEKQIALR